MLNIMRQKAGSWLIKIVLFAIVIVFVFWGVGSFRDNTANRVAEVNGEAIELAEYRRAYNNYIENLRRQFRDSLTPEMIEMLQVKQQVVNGLINQKLILQSARKLDLRVTDEELVETIRRIEAFKTAGIFDNSRYRAIMDRIRTTPEDFEMGQRQELLIGKMRAMVTGGVQVSDGEVREWYDHNNSTVSIDFLKFSAESYKDITPTAEDLQVFFEENKDAYKTNPLAKVRYLQFRPDDYQASMTVDDTEIKEYYESFPAEFQTEKTVQARHILIKVDQNAPAETIEKKRLEAMEILEKARDGEDFAELAKTFSDGPSKDQGGYLGAFTQGSMVKPFSDKAFSMAVGDISDPVQTRFGWHIIKVEKINEASVRSLEEAGKDIREKLMAQKSKDMAYEQAEIAYDAAFSNEDLAKTADELKLQLLTTDFFDRTARDLKVIDAPKFATTAFELDEMAVSNVLEHEDGYYILQKIETQPEKVPALETVEAAVRLDLIKSKQDEQAKADAEACLSAIKAGADMAAEGKKYNVEPVTSGFFKRDETIPHVGSSRDIAQAAFGLSDQKRWPDAPLKWSDGYYVIQFKERKLPDLDGFVAERDKIRESLLSQKERAYFSQWLETERANSEIIVGKAFGNE